MIFILICMLLTVVGTIYFTVHALILLSNERAWDSSVYSLQVQCYVCSKMLACEDVKKLREAVDKIHQSNDGTHLGAGNITMQCVNQETTVK